MLVQSHEENIIRLLPALPNNWPNGRVYGLKARGNIEVDIELENNKIIINHPPDIIFIYSKRSAESFVEIVKKYALNGLMTESRVLCISEKVLSVLKNAGWKKLEIFEPGEEMMKLEL